MDFITTKKKTEVLTGNKVIDDFINKWEIDFVLLSQFINIEFIAEGGFSIIYKATWVDGPVSNQSDVINSDSCESGFVHQNNYTVALKKLKSKNITLKELNELEVSCQLSSKNANIENINKYFGITQDPNTKDLMIIMPHYTTDMANCIAGSNFYNITWKEKLSALSDIINGLKSIHNAGIIHGDLHAGNILCDKSKEPKRVVISDLGISRFVNRSIDNSNEIYGVIPYMAPEIFQGQKFTKASDIYSFGIMMWELMIGKRPFYNEIHNVELIIKICDGLRPSIVTNAPEGYVELMNECWHSDPIERPLDISIRYRLRNIIDNESNNPTKVINPQDIGLVTINNPDAIYNDRPISDMIQSAMSTRSIRSQSINLETAVTVVDKQKHYLGESIKRRKEDDEYTTKEMELDINTNSNEFPYRYSNDKR